MESAMLLDDDWSQFLTPGAGLGSDLRDDGVLRDDAFPVGSWSLGEPQVPSPRGDDIRQDSFWGDSAEEYVLEGSPAGLFGGVQYDDELLGGTLGGKHSPHFWEDVDPLQSYKDVTNTGLSLGFIGTPLEKSPIDVKFELGNVFDQSLSFLVDDSFADTAAFQFLDNSTADVSTSRSALVDSVPASPLGESMIGLDGEEDDSMHDAELVFELLHALDSGIHDDTALLHVSPEEVESVLSRGGSSDNLASLDEPVSPPVAVTPSSVSSLETSAKSPALSSAVPAMVGFGSATFISSAPISTAFTLKASTPSLITSGQRSTIAAAQLSSASIATSLPLTIATVYQQSSLVTKLAASPKTIASQPYGRADILTERRQRKKEQNKTAALRYRQKKRQEKGHTTTEVEELEQINAELRHRAEELSREISYLRGLLDEIRS